MILSILLQPGEFFLLHKSLLVNGFAYVMDCLNRVSADILHDSHVLGQLNYGLFHDVAVYNVFIV